MSAFVLSSFAALVASSPPGHALDTTGIRFIGRFDHSDPKGVRFGWPGSAIEFSFLGTTLSAEFFDAGSNSYVVDVDGVISRLNLREGQATYVLAKGLPSGSHRVKIVRRTEGFFAPTTFLGATTDGEFITTASERKRILVIGDAIAAGYGIEGKSVDCPFSADTENQYLTFPAVAARSFDADVTTLAWSGYGIVRNYSGGRETLLSIMDRTIPNDPNAPRAAPENPHVIIVHVGTSDFVDASSGKAFRPVYDGLLKRLRAQNPDAMIYAAMGPMLSDELLEDASRTIEAAVQARKAAGDAKIAFIQFLLPGRDHRGCHWHPNVEGHRRMADILIKKMEENLSWKRVTQ
ncbi:MULTISPECIES: SGNH/GDSL hydrolase family protein [Rhodomicrobium]|uniref:SGNH/GDSL hydrolase family protein n=1 Tax=Rhodomicrobium TaxID=1068 RepID=UPI00148357C7|nr:MULTISPECIES: SGNH/GDSL hydrolase family protein [Rhodomicrobium]